jgi:hypothetical protein
MQKAGLRWAGCSGRDTRQPQPPPGSLLCTAANQEAEQRFWGQVTLELREGGTCKRYSLHVLLLFLPEGPGVNILVLTKAAVLHFALHPFCSGGLCILACRSLDMAVLMSSSPRPLILCSPQIIITIIIKI